MTFTKLTNIAFMYIFRQLNIIKILYILSVGKLLYLACHSHTQYLKSRILLNYFDIQGRVILLHSQSSQ